MKQESEVKTMIDTVGINKKLEEQLELLSELSKKDLPEKIRIEIAEEIRQIVETYVKINR